MTTPDGALVHEPEVLKTRERGILEQIAKGAALETILNTVCLMIEEQAAGMLCSILLLDDDGEHLTHGAAPNLPDDYVMAIDGFAIGPNAGSCGTAAYMREPVIVSDIAEDPRWVDVRELALSHELHSCWSTPVFASGGDLLGTFAMYYREPREPNTREHQLVEIATRLAGIAIENARRQKSLREAEERYRRSFENLPVGLYRTTPDGEILDANQALVEMSGFPDREAFLAGNATDFYVHPEDREEWKQEIERDGWIRNREQQLYRHDGTVIWVRDNARAVKDEQGRVRFYEGSLEDITERKRSEDALRASEAKYRTLFEQSKDSVYIIDRESRLVDANQATLEMFGYDREQAVGLDVREAFYADRHELDRFREEIRRAGYVKDFEVKLKHKEGNLIDCLVTYNVLQDSDGKVIGYQGIVRDVTEQKRLQSQLSYLAHRDALTGLFNRRRFEEELEQQLQSGRGGLTPHALLWLDLDRFKEINDSLGHRAGDELLGVVADVLTSTLREGDVVARIGGDEFGILCPRTTRDQAIVVAHKVLRAIGQKNTVIAGRTVRITASIGIACYPGHALMADELMIYADLAMYRAKDEGRNCWRIYAADPDQGVVPVPSVEWVQRVRTALEENHLVLHAQSVYDLKKDRIHGCELLLRLMDGNRCVPPGAFLDTVDRFGLMGDVDRWVVEEALKQASVRHRAGQRTYFEINLSGRAIGNQQLLDRIESIIREDSVDPRRLIFEITEKAAITQLHEAKRFLHRLRELGCKFALDDFGIGFSSFYQLKHLPVDYLKIDGGFIRNLPEDPADKSIVRSIVNVAKSMHMATIAECVENETTLRLLKVYGVDYAQGFYIDRPRPLAEWQPEDVHVNNLIQMP